MIALHSDTAGRTRVRTTVGVRVGRRRWDLYRQLERGAFLAGFDAVHAVRDISADPNRIHLVTIGNARLLDRFDAIVASRRAR